MKHSLTILLRAVVALMTACNKPKEIPDKYRPRFVEGI